MTSDSICTCELSVHNYISLIYQKQKITLIEYSGNIYVFNFTIGTDALGIMKLRSLDT